MKKNTLLCILLLTALLLIFTACGDAPADTPSGDSQVTEPESGPESDSVGIFSSFTTTDIDGNPIDQTILSGHDLTMLNIWATFCGPCLNELPDLGELNDEYEGFQIIGLLTDIQGKDGSISASGREKVGEIIENTGADYLHIVQSQDLYSAYLNSVQYVPTTVFIDKDGNMVGEAYVGSRSKEDWAAIIEGLL